jgi:hypothetical protein
MTYEERRTVVRDDEPAVDAGGRHVVYEDRVATARPSGATVLSRVVIFIFGLIQLVIALRIVFLAIGAREGNPIVATVLDLSRPLVAPFEGILNTNALATSGSTFDTTAVVALIGWTILEIVVLAFVRILRREP